MANARRQRGRRRSTRIEEDILYAVERSPHASTSRWLVSRYNGSKPATWRALKKQLYPHQVQHVQAETTGSSALKSVLPMAAALGCNPNFHSRVLVTDETCFTRNGIFSCRNMHTWSVENLHFIQETRFQHHFY
jgi:hypothetical protein